MRPTQPTALFDRLAIRDAFRKVAERNEVAAALVFRQGGADFKRIVSQLGHGSCAIEELDKF